VVMGFITILLMDKSIDRTNGKIDKWLDNSNDTGKAIYYAAQYLFVAIIIHGAIG